MDLTLTDLACARGGLRVLEGVTFTLAPGHALILQGRNGIGKTTLLRTIAGLQPPLSGKISADPDSIAYAGHADGLKPTLTARENLDFWAAIFGSNDTTAALSALHLTPLAHRPTATLSAGQKRRLGLARLLVTGRRIWLLDEPTVSLDTAATALFASMISRHLGQGGSAIIASHIDLGLTEATALNLASYASRLTLPANAFDGVTA